jgi:hypothetical protein
MWDATGLIDALDRERDRDRPGTVAESSQSARRECSDRVQCTTIEGLRPVQVAWGD